jgi:indole-3-glycerol phosphate synthase
MKDFLNTILARKREEVKAAKESTSIGRLRERPMFSVARRSLSAALNIKGLAVIAEVKKASPSKGVIRESFDHKLIANEYVQGGANALSVLTDEHFFQGKRSYLEELRQIVSVPLLRKDFIIDSYQLIESKAYGADAILLIAAALEPQQLKELHSECNELGLECLVEVHSEKELSSISGIHVRLIGVNNRNLSTFETDLGTSMRLRPLLPSDAITVSESGINSADDLKSLADHGYHAVLIGEMLMKSEEPGKTLKRLISETAKK